MAIFVAGKTICALCGEPIAAAAEWFALPDTLPGIADDAAFLQGRSVHRKHLLESAHAAQVRDAWRAWWLAMVRGQRVIASDAHRLIYEHRSGRWFRYVYFPHFIELQDAASALEKLRAFLTSDTRTGAPASLRTDDFEYHVVPQNGSMSFRITREGSDALRDTFEAGEWADFASIPASTNGS